MADFYPGSYDAVVCGTQWVESKNGNIGLQVDVTVRNAAGATRAMSGFIWFTPKTMRSPGDHEDGTPKRSWAERSLNAIGYSGPLAEAKEIGRSMDLRGTRTRVRLREEEYRGETRLKVDGFYAVDEDSTPRLPTPSAKAVDRLFGGAPPASAPADDGEEATDDIPF